MGIVTNLSSLRFWIATSMHFYEKQSQYIKMYELVLVSIVGNTVEFENVTMNMTMNPTNSDKASENRKKKRVWHLSRIESATSWFEGEYSNQ